MVTEDLLTYLREELHAGELHDVIVARLLESGGWEEADIAEAFRVLGVTQPVSVPLDTRINPEAPHDFLGMFSDEHLHVEPSLPTPVTKDVRVIDTVHATLPSVDHPREKPPIVIEVPTRTESTVFVTPEIPVMPIPILPLQVPITPKKEPVVLAPPLQLPKTREPRQRTPH